MSPHAVYGYKKDPNDKKHWLVDEEAADVVRMIFDLYVNGYGTRKIAHYLEEHKIFSPSHYYKNKGIPYTARLKENPYEWDAETIGRILRRQEYIGNAVNFKTCKKSYKVHKIIKNPEEKQVVLESVNEPIIGVEVWKKAQALNEKRRRVPVKREPDIFQGYAFCADCGNKMYIRRVKGKKDRYVCGGYSKKTAACRTHFILQEDLCELVLTSLNEMIFSARIDEKKFAEKLRKKADNNNKGTMRKMAKEAEKLRARSASLNKIIHQIFEDRVEGKITEERYLEMLSSYESEQSNIKLKLSEYEEKISSEKSAADDIESFIRLVNEYTKIKELTPSILAEFIQEIRVHQAEKTENGKIQAVDIVYKGVGVLD